MTTTLKKLIALDIDGTIMFEDGFIPQEVKDEVQRLLASGHEVMVATGRGGPITLPVVKELGIAPQYIVCANGAVILERDESEESGYRRAFVKTFDPRDLLLELLSLVPEGNFAVEDEHGFLMFTKGFDYRGGDKARKVLFEELLAVPATRVILVSSEHTTEEFTAIVSQMGMHEASYSVGWTAWLDITPHGVNKATALEQVRLDLGIAREEVYAIGDGRNDVEMLEWAGEFGRSAVMGSAPEEIHGYASEITEALAQGGSARFLSTII
ncbi:MAG: HAD family hydrolase [Microbacteriaceae bacterium]